MDLKLDTSLWITDVMSDTVGKVVLLSIHGLLQKYLSDIAYPCRFAQDAL